MAYKAPTRTREIATNKPNAGTAFTLPGAGFGGARAFSTSLSAGDTLDYRAENADGSLWEEGLGTFSAGTLTRTTIYESSNSNAAVDFSGSATNVTVGVALTGIRAKSIGTAVQESSRNQPNGFAGLDENGNVIGDIVPRTGDRQTLSQLRSTTGELATATDYPSIFKYAGDLVQPEEFIDFNKTAELIVQDAPIIAKRIHSVAAVTIEGSKYGDIFVGLSSASANTTNAYFSEDGQHWRKLPALPSSAKWKLTAKRNVSDDYITIIACQTVAHQYVYLLRCQWADLSDPTKTLTWQAVDMLEVKLWSASPGVLRNWVYPSTAETTTDKAFTVSQVGSVANTLSLPSTGTWVSKELELVQGAISSIVLINIDTKSVRVLQFDSTLQDYKVVTAQDMPETLTSSAKIVSTKDHLFVFWSTNGTYFDKCYKAPYSVIIAAGDLTEISIGNWINLSANLAANLLYLTAIAPVKSVYASDKIVAGIGVQGLAYTEDGVNWKTQGVAASYVLGCYDNLIVFGNVRDQKYRLETRVFNTLTGTIVTITAPLQWYAEASTLTAITNKLIGVSFYSGNVTLSYTARISGGQPESIQQYFRRTSTMAATLYIPCDCAFYVLDPATVYASSTISLPYTPFDGQTITIAFGGTITTGGTVITTLAWANGTVVGTLPTTAIAGQAITLKYCLANNVWYLI